MKLHSALAAATRIGCLLLALAPWTIATGEAQTTDPRVADLVRAGKLRVGLFLPQYGKDPDGLKTTVWVEAARAYVGRVGVPLAIVEHATPPEAIAGLKESRVADICYCCYCAIDDLRRQPRVGSHPLPAQRRP